MNQSADLITKALAGWLSARFADTQLSLGDGDVVAGKTVIRLRLVNLSVESGQNRQMPTILLRLDYFIGVHAADPLSEHKLLGEMACALFENPVFQLPSNDRFTVQIEQNSSGVLGLTLSTLLTRVRQQPAAPPVLYPPILQVTEIGALEGMVRGPDGSVIAGALVEIPTLDARRLTGADGKFRFDNLPNDGRPLRLVARKQQFQQSVMAEAGKHLTLQLSLEA